MREASRILPHSGGLVRVRQKILDFLDHSFCGVFGYEITGGIVLDEFVVPFHIIGDHRPGSGARFDEAESRHEAKTDLALQADGECVRTLNEPREYDSIREPLLLDATPQFIKF